MGLRCSRFSSLSSTTNRIVIGVSINNEFTKKWFSIKILLAMATKRVCQSLEFEAVLRANYDIKKIHNKLCLLPITFVLPPSFALYASPTPQFELLKTAAITPALFSPCLPD